MTEQIKELCKPLSAKVMPKSKLWVGNQRITEKEALMIQRQQAANQFTSRHKKRSGVA